MDKLNFHYYKLIKEPQKRYDGLKTSRLTAARMNRDILESEIDLRKHEQISKKNIRLIETEQRKLLSLLGKEPFPDFSMEKSLFDYNYPGFCYKRGGEPRSLCPLLESRSRKIIDDMEGKLGILCPAANLISDTPSLTEILSADPKLLLILCDLRTTAALMVNQSLLDYISQSLINLRLISHEAEAKKSLKDFRRTLIEEFFETLRGTLDKNKKSSLALIEPNSEQSLSPDAYMTAPIINFEDDVIEAPEGEEVEEPLQKDSFDSLNQIFLGEMTPICSIPNTPLSTGFPFQNSILLMGDDLDPDEKAEQQKAIFDHLRKLLEEISNYNKNNSEFWNIFKSVTTSSAGSGDTRKRTPETDKENYTQGSNRPRAGGFTFRPPTQIKDSVEFSSELAVMREYLYTGNWPPSTSDQGSSAQSRRNSPSISTPDIPSTTSSSGNQSPVVIRSGDNLLSSVRRKREKMRDLTACPCYTKSLRRVSCKACHEKLNRILHRANREYSLMEKASRETVSSRGKSNIQKSMRASEMEYERRKLNRDSKLHYKSIAPSMGNLKLSMKNASMPLKQALKSLNPRKSLPSLSPTNPFSGLPSRSIPGTRGQGEERPKSNASGFSSVSGSTFGNFAGGERRRPSSGSIFDPTTTYWTLKIGRLDLMRLAHELYSESVEQKVSEFNTLGHHSGSNLTPTPSLAN